jgi:beta-glucuronidase
MTNIQNPYGRRHTLLNGDWNYVIDPYETGSLDMFGNESEQGYFQNRTPADHWASEINLPESPTMQVPGDWNTQVEMLRWYEGTVWYHSKLPNRAELQTAGERTFIRFGAANYAAVVWVNGTEVVRHVGGFTPFEAEITDLIQDTGNFVIVKVNDERLKDGVPTTNTDWWNYGGITRDVMLVSTPQTFIRDYFCQLDQEGSEICGHVLVDGLMDGAPINGEVHLQIPELNIEETITLDGNTGRFAIAANPELWSPENPKRYGVSFQYGDDKISQLIGFRTIKTEGENIVLNGESIFLKGISSHEEAFADEVDAARRANSETDARRIFSEIKALGCNFARLAHYTHNDHMTRVADELGILLWCEVPVYWGINWQSQTVLDNARNQLTEMIERDRNCASIILWSVANETPTSEARTNFLAELVRTAKQLDPVRLTTAALFMHPQKITEDGQVVRTYTLDDPLAEYLDVMGCNQYLGWYYTKLEDIRGSRWFSDMNKPLIMSEFGAGAPKHRRGTPTERWTEDYQQSVYQEQLAMMNDISFLRGLSPWILKDFRTPKRPLVGIQDYYNRKGLLSDQGEKKLAWQTLHDYYQEKSTRVK